MSLLDRSPAPQPAGGGDALALVLEAVRAGRTVLLRQDFRPAQGYLVLPVATARAEELARFPLHGAKSFALALSPDRFEALGLPVTRPLGDDGTLLVQDPGAAPWPPLLAGGEKDLLERARALAAPTGFGAQLPSPNGLRLLRSHWGGVLVHPTPVDCAVDLARLAGLVPAAFLAAVPLDARSPRPAEPAASLPSFTLGELTDYRRRASGARLVMSDFRTRLPTRFGLFEVSSFEDALTGHLHLALACGDPSGEEPVLTRIHSECLTGDVLGSSRCDCGPQLHRAFELIQRQGRGLVLYLRQEGRGIGLYNKLRAYRLQQQGVDTVEANERLGFPGDLRDFRLAAEMLERLGIRRVRLLTNNPAKIAALEENGIEVVERLELAIVSSADNRAYLETKRSKMGHLLGEP